MSRRREPEVILRNGKPTAVTLSITSYGKILKRLEDKEDLRILERMRKRKLRFRRLTDVLKEHGL